MEKRWLYLIFYFASCQLILKCLIMMEMAARGRSGVGRMENEARKTEIQANGIGDCRELLVSSIGRTMWWCRSHLAPCALPGQQLRAGGAVRRGGGIAVSCIFTEKTHNSYPLAVQKNQPLKGF